MRKQLALFLSALLFVGTWATPAAGDSTGSPGATSPAAIETEAGISDETGEEVSQDQSVLLGASFGATSVKLDYETQLDYENKICTVYVPEASNNFYMSLDLDREAGPLSGKISYVSGANLNKGAEISRSLPMDNATSAFTTAKATPTPLSSTTATGQMQMELTTLRGKENWTIQVQRKTNLKSLAVTSANNKSVAMSGYVMSSTEIENTAELTGDYVTLTLGVYDAAVDAVYVNDDKATTEGTTAGTLVYRLNLNQDQQVTTAIVKAVREGEDSRSQEYQLTFYRTRTDNIKTITLDQAGVDLTADQPTAKVTATVTSAVDMDSYPLTWTTEDASIATVTVDPEDPTQALLTGLSDGVTEFSVTDGYVTASGQVLVEKNKTVNALADMTVASSMTVRDTSRYESSLDAENKVVTFYTPAWRQTFVYMFPSFTAGKTVQKATLAWTTYSGADKTYEMEKNRQGDFQFYCPGAYLPYDAKSAEGGSYTLTIETPAGEEVWTILVKRCCTLNGLSVTAGDGSSVDLSSSFQYSNREYLLGISTSLESLNLQLTRGGQGDAITVNDTPVELDETTGQGTYEMTLTAGVHKLLIQVSNGDLKTGEYVVYVYGIAPAAVTFLKEPETAIVNITDAKGQHQNDQDGVYYLTMGDYSYTLSAKGYKSASGSFTVESSDPMTVKQSLEEAPENTELKNFSSDWSSYSRNAGTNDNNAIIDAATPISSDAISVKWMKQLGASVSSGSTSAGIIVNDRWYGYVGDNLVVADKDTGNLLNSQKMTGAPGYQYMPPVYGDGMIFVAQSGAVEAFNADTLEPLWRYKDKLGGTPRAQMRYDDGYVYVGFYNNPTSSANFVCLCVTDEDPTSTNEEKQATWTFSHVGGFYFAGSWSNSKYVFVTSDAGNGSTSILYGVEKATGNMVQKISINGSQRGNVVYYEGRLFLTTTTGYTYAFNLTQEGLIDTENTIEPLYLGGRSTNTPVIYNNRLYFACADGAVGPYKDAGIYVVDINPATGAMSLAYSVPTEGNCQASGILSTAYFNETGYVYVYFTCNVSSGSIYMVKDKAGMTEADPASGVLWKASQSQFCLHRLYADNNGTIYYTNDGSWTYALETTYLGLTNIQAEGGNAVVDGGAFKANASEHTILVDPDLTTLKLTFTAEKGTTVWINDQTVTESYPVSLDQGQATIKVTVVNGTNSKIYTLHVEARSKDSSLQSLYVTEDETYAETGTLTPEFAATETAYSYTYADGTGTAYLWPEAADKAALEVTAVSGVKDCQAGTVLTAVTQDGRDRYEIPFADTSQPTVVKLRVTAECTKYQTEYRLTLNPIDHTSPVAENLRVSGRKTDCAAISFSCSEPATGYYVVTGSGGETPEASYIMEHGTSFQALQGGNSIEVTGLNNDQTQVSMVLVDASGNISQVYQAAIEAYVPLEGISLDQDKLTLHVNKSTATLTASLNPANPTDMPEISWATGNETIAAVEPVEGNALQAVVTAKKSGTTTITVKAGEFTAVTEVTVDVDTAGLTVTASQTEISVLKDDSFQLTFTYKTPKGSDVRALKAILTYPSDKLSIDLTKDCQVSDLKASDGFWVEKDNTYSAYTLGDSMADTGSITLTFKALADCRVDADEISMSMELAINTASNRVKGSAASTVTFAHNYVKTDQGMVCSVCHKRQTVLLGDLNGDGQITNADVALLLNIITQGTSTDMEVADMNGDGLLTNADVARLLSIVTSGSN